MTNRLAEAEPLYRRALAIDEKSLGPHHPSVARDLNNLALLLKDTNRLAEAEPLHRRALAIDEKSLGRDHPAVATILTRLALLRAEVGDWEEAARLHRRAKPAMTATRNWEEGGDRSGITKGELTRNREKLRVAARAAFWAAPRSTQAREEGFELAQWALQTAAADALSQMSSRFAKGAGPLAQVVRDRQNLLAQRQSEDRLLLAALGRPI
jgi:tetratricopeptide (TPR) repeat protein